MSIGYGVQEIKEQRGFRRFEIGLLEANGVGVPWHGVRMRGLLPQWIIQDSIGAWILCGTFKQKV